MHLLEGALAAQERLLDEPIREGGESKGHDEEDKVVGVVAETVAVDATGQIEDGVLPQVQTVGALSDPLERSQLQNQLQRTIGPGDEIEHDDGSAQGGGGDPEPHAGCGDVCHSHDKQDQRHGRHDRGDVESSGKPVGKLPPLA